MKFKVGDIVKCINIGSLRTPTLILPPLKLNAEYIINSIVHCKCGVVLLDVGLICDGKYVSCKCGNRIPQNGVRLCNSVRFIKRQPIEEQIKEAVEEEDYELAHLLSQLTN